jgi:protein-disulfide isomerase
MPKRRGLADMLGLIVALLALACSPAFAQDGPLPPQTFLSGATDDPAKPEELREAGPLGDTVIGKPDAPVTIIEYASLGCPACRLFHSRAFPILKRQYIDTGKVVFIFREFPIGKAAQTATMAARCVPQKDYFRISERLMANQGRWTAPDATPDILYKLVQDTGLSREAFDSCLSNQNISDGLVWVKKRGRKLGVKGTPTFFVNGQRIRSLESYEEMRTLIELHLASAKPA